MSTMLEDFRHMDVRDANMTNGAILLYGTPNWWECISPIFSMWRIGRKVKDYSRRWAYVPQNEKKDVIAALRMGSKVGIAMTKIIQWL